MRSKATHAIAMLNNGPRRSGLHEPEGTPPSFSCPAEEQFNMGIGRVNSAALSILPEPLKYKINCFYSVPPTYRPRAISLSIDEVAALRSQELLPAGTDILGKRATIAPSQTVEFMNRVNEEDCLFLVTWSGKPNNLHLNLLGNFLTTDWEDNQTAVYAGKSRVGEGLLLCADDSLGKNGYLALVKLINSHSLQHSIRVAQEKETRIGPSFCRRKFEPTETESIIEGLTSDIPPSYLDLEALFDADLSITRVQKLKFCAWLLTQSNLGEGNEKNCFALNALALGRHGLELGNILTSFLTPNCNTELATGEHAANTLDAHAAIQNERAIPIMIAYMFSRESMIAQRACLALSKFGNKAIDACEAALQIVKGKTSNDRVVRSNHQDISLKVAAVELIGALGPAARHAAPTLMNAMQDVLAEHSHGRPAQADEFNYAASLAVALEKIQGPRAKSANSIALAIRKTLEFFDDSPGSNNFIDTGCEVLGRMGVVNRKVKEALSRVHLYDGRRIATHASKMLGLGNPRSEWV